MITVYTNPNCVQCDQTKRMFDKANVSYNTKDLSENPKDLQRFLDMGFKSAPIVETSHDIWSGFRIDKINGVVKGHNE